MGIQRHLEPWLFKGRMGASSLSPSLSLAFLFSRTRSLLLFVAPSLSHIFSEVQRLFLEVSQVLKCLLELRADLKRQNGMKNTAMHSPEPFKWCNLTLANRGKHFHGRQRQAS